MLVQPDLRFRCTACHSALKVPLKRRGTELHCPRCQRRLRVPLSSDTALTVPRAEDDDSPVGVSMLPALMRFAAWTVCVGWVSYLIWMYCNPLELLRGTPPTLAVSLAVGVQSLAACIAARAVEGVSR